jgi:hypothetical protein
MAHLMTWMWSLPFGMQHASRSSCHLPSTSRSASARAQGAALGRSMFHLAPMPHAHAQRGAKSKSTSTTAPSAAQARKPQVTSLETGDRSQYSGKERSRGPQQAAPSSKKQETAASSRQQEVLGRHYFYFGLPSVFSALVLRACACACACIRISE